MCGCAYLLHHYPTLIYTAHPPPLLLLGKLQKNHQKLLHFQVDVLPPQSCSLICVPGYLVGAKNNRHLVKLSPSLELIVARRYFILVRLAWEG